MQYVELKQYPLAYKAKSVLIRLGMSRSLIMPSVVLLALIMVLAVAADNSSGKPRGGLVCFAITPPPDKPKSSCDQLRAAKDAACAGMVTNGAMNPGVDCPDATEATASYQYIRSCRCCALAH